MMDAETLEYVADLARQLAMLCQSVAPDLAVDLETVAARALELLEALKAV